MKHAHSFERVLLTVWVGGMWTIGYLVAPVLFTMLDSRVIAGNIAGLLFSITSYVGLLCGVLLLALAINASGRQSVRQWRVWIVSAMISLTVISQFVITPLMKDIKQARLAAKLVSPEMLERFQLLHGISTGLFMLTSLMGLVIVWFGVLHPTNQSGRKADF